MSIEFRDKNLQELYCKGTSEKFLGIPSNVLRLFFSALTIAGSASVMEDVLNPPPLKCVPQKDGSITVLLCDGWELNFFLKISDNENEISVVSLISAHKKNKGAVYE